MQNIIILMMSTLDVLASMLKQCKINWRILRKIITEYQNCIQHDALSECWILTERDIAFNTKNALNLYTEGKNC